MVRTEIRKPIQGPPRLWVAEIVVEDVGTYLVTFGGDLTPLRTSRERRLELFSTKSESAYTVERNRKQFQATKAARPTVTIDPNLALYSPGDDAFYRFDRFTPKFAVFRYLRSNH